jgi:hypothetical protein
MLPQCGARVKASRRHAARCCGAKPGLPRPVKVPTPEDKAMQLEIDALKEAVACRAPAGGPEAPTVPRKLAF